MPGLLLVLALAGAGCGVYQAGVRTGPAHAQPLPPVDPAQVQLFGGDDPTLSGQEVGYVVGVSDLDEQGLALQRMRGAAAKLGADAIVDLRFEILQSSSVVARGRAVRRAPVAPMPVEPAPAPSPATAPTEPAPAPSPATAPTEPAPAPAPAEEVMP
jgi:hypothetical protein